CCEPREAGRLVECLERRAVALIADERRRRGRAEARAARKAGAGENPMLRVLDGISSGLPRPVPPAAAVPVADPGQRVFRPVRARLGPPMIERARGAALMADDRAAVVDDMDAPPADVRAEERDVAAPRGESLDRVAGRLAPVLVVPDAD